MAACLAAAVMAQAQVPKRVALILPGPELDSDGVRMRESFVGLLASQGIERSGVLLSTIPAGPTTADVERAVSGVVASRPDVICVTGRVNIATTARLVRAIPIVFFNADDPVRDGLVASQAKPGGNATGIATRISDLHAKRIELFREIRPDAAAIAFLVPEAARDSPAIANFRKVVERAGMRAVEIASPERLDRAGLVEAIRRSKADAFISIGFEQPQESWVRLQNETGIPGLFQNAEIARKGGLLANGPDFRGMEARVAAIAAKILKGQDPGTIPVEELTRPYIVINVGTAETLGIRVPQPVLLRADEVIGRSETAK